VEVCAIAQRGIEKLGRARLRSACLCTFKYGRAGKGRGGRNNQGDSSVRVMVVESRRLSEELEEERGRGGALDSVQRNGRIWD